jgi:hypothetical protein
VSSLGRDPNLVLAVMVIGSGPASCQNGGPDGWNALRWAVYYRRTPRLLVAFMQKNPQYEVDDKVDEGFEIETPKGAGGKDRRRTDLLDDGADMLGGVEGEDVVSGFEDEDR